MTTPTTPTNEQLTALQQARESWNTAHTAPNKQALIAAAPDLLAVVKNLMACMDAEPEVYHPAFIASARAALAKAKGE